MERRNSREHYSNVAAVNPLKEVGKECKVVHPTGDTG